MCKRDTADPLVRRFLDEYHLNLLPVPRELAQCGDLYVRHGRGVSAPGDVRALLEPAITLPPVVLDEDLADIAGTLSAKVSANVGLRLLQNFLVALGAGGVVDKLSAGYKGQRASSLHFRFADATRDSVDPLSLGTALIDRRFDARHPWVAAGNQYYVVAAVVRARSMSILAKDERESAVDIGADVLMALGAEAGVSVERDQTGETTYRGRKRLAIGVELYELRYEETAQKLTMLSPEKVIELRRGRPVAPPLPAFLGQDEGALLELAD